MRVQTRDSCVIQLCITCDIYQLLDDNLGTEGVSLDISKAFDKIWDEDLLYKLNQNVRSVNFLNFITDFLYRRKQICLNRQFSS